jgi:hypothetical protein
VRHQVQRKIERSDRRDRTDGESAGNPEMTLPGGKRIEVEKLAVLTPRFFGAGGESGNRACSLRFRKEDRFACFADDCVHKLRLPRFDSFAIAASNAARAWGGRSRTFGNAATAASIASTTIRSSPWGLSNCFAGVRIDHGQGRRAFAPVPPISKRGIDRRSMAENLPANRHSFA